MKAKQRMTREEGEYSFPTWLEEILQRDWRGLRNEIFDHRRHIGNIAVCYPYGVSDGYLRSLIAFCDEHDFRFSIMGDGSDYHEKTMRVVLWRPQDEAELSTVYHWFTNGWGD
jgi:hypothetical protein